MPAKKASPLAAMLGGGPAESAPPPDAGADGELTLAAGDLIAAINAGDAAATASAFKAMKTLCEGYEE